jgi:hypothetical protein
MARSQCPVNAPSSHNCAEFAPYALEEEFVRSSPSLVGGASVGGFHFQDVCDAPLTDAGGVAVLEEESRGTKCPGMVIHARDSRRYWRHYPSECSAGTDNLTGSWVQHLGLQWWRGRDLTIGPLPGRVCG